MVNRLIFLFTFIFAINNSIFAGERFPVPYRPDIDLTKNNVAFQCGDISFSVDISRPLIPFKNLRLIVKGIKNNNYINDLKIHIKVNMKMDMGNFNYDLYFKDDSYKVDFILPKCIWGDKRWFIKLIIHGKDYSCHKVLLFDMER